MERTPTEAGTAVSIRYRAEESPEGPLHRYVVCEFAEGDRWALNQMIYEGQVLPEPELALVNSDLLLQDLTDNPERFEERKHLVPKPSPPVVTSTPSAASESSSDPAGPTPLAGSDPIAARSPDSGDAAATPGTVAPSPGRVRLHTDSSAPRTPPSALIAPDAIASDANSSNASPPAAPALNQAGPRDQIPSPSSGGSD